MSYQLFSVGFCLWQTEKSILAIAILMLSVRSTLPNLYLTFISATMATLLMSLLDNDRGCGGKGQTGIHRMGHLSHLIINILLSEVTLLGAFKWYTNKYLHALCLSRGVYSYISSSDFLIKNFLIVFLLSFWQTSQTIDHSP